MTLTPEQKQKLLGAGFSASKISAYEQSQGPSVVEPSGFSAAVKDIPNDIKGAFQGSVQATTKGIQNAQEVRGRVESGQTSPLAGTLQTIGGGLKAGAEVVGQGFLGLLKSFVSPKTEQQVAGVVEKGAEKLSATEPVQKLALWYASLSDEQKRNVDASVGVGEGVATIFGLGPAAKATRSGLAPVAEKALMAGEKALPIAGTVVKGTVRLPAVGVSEIQGALTGTSGETIRQAFGAARRGGKELDEFTAALRGKTTPEQLVSQLREGTDKINAEKSAKFGQMLKEIGNQPVDTTSILQEVQTDLNKIGVRTNENGSLDFSQSKFRTVPQAANKLQSMYDEVRRLGNTQTVQGIDTSRQALGALLLSGDDASAKTANLAITNAINRVRNAGKTVDGYGEALAQFGDDAEFLSEISRALSSGDQATIDTAYRKLATTLKTNNEQRRNLLMELDEATDGYILSSVAGQQLSEQLPRGLFRQVAAGIAGASVLTGGISAGIIPALFFASPRVTGEVLRALGIAQGKVDALVGAFSKVKQTLNSEVKTPPSPKGFIKNPLVGESPSIPKELEGLAAEARKYKSAEEFDSAVKSKINTVVRLAGNEIEDIRIIGSTAAGKAKPNDTDILVSLKKKRSATTSENIHDRVEFNKVIEAELKDLFPNRVHVTVADYNATRGAKMSLTDFYNKVVEKK